MRLYKYLLPLSLICLLVANSVIAAPGGQDDNSYEQELNDRDFDALRDFLKARRTEDVLQKKSNLIVSGDCHFEWRHLNETCCGNRERGHKRFDAKGRPISRNDFDVEANLYFNCLYEKSWAVVQVRYDNSAGVDDNDHPCIGLLDPDATGSNCGSSCLKRSIGCNGDPEGYHGSGVCDKVCLKKAYFGYNFLENDCARVDIELGRRGNLYSVLESNVQFLSRFDGVYLKYDQAFEEVADWYLHSLAFVIDERVNHFGWAVETGLIGIADTNFEVKYSFIDWIKNGRNRCHVDNPVGFNFLNSQVILAYNLDPAYLGKGVRFYAAYLYNHAADDLIVYRKHGPYNAGRQNMAWYAGVFIGKVRKEGDWAVELQYQYVEAQAMPDQDSAGIGRGNVLDESLTTCSRRGNTNFKGWKIEALYAFTDNITLDSIFEASVALDPKIGGAHTYNKFECEAVYAF